MRLLLSFDRQFTWTYVMPTLIGAPA